MNTNIDDDYMVYDLELVDENKTCYELLLDNTSCLSNKVTVKSILKDMDISSKEYRFRKLISIIQHDYEFINYFKATVIYMNALTYVRIVDFIHMKNIEFRSNKIYLCGLELVLTKEFSDYEIQIGINL